MNVESQLLLALRHIAMSVAGAAGVTVIWCVRKRDIVVGCHLLRRRFARYRRPS